MHTGRSASADERVSRRRVGYSPVPGDVGADGKVTASPPMR
jgi:hypothetical protein